MEPNANATARARTGATGGSGAPKPWPTPVRPDATGRLQRADVVVVTYNSGVRVLRCVEHLRAAGATSIIVVDNASTDDTVAGLRTAQAPVTIIELPENVGFGRGVNAGAAAGTGDAIVLVNDDAYVEPDFLREMLRPLDADPRCGMVAGLLFIPGTDRVDSFGVQLDQRLAGWSRGRHQRDGDDFGPLSVPSGGAAAYRRSAFDAVGGFDDGLFAYWEDVDLGLRLARAGWTCTEAPAARGEHEGGASFRPGSPFQRRVASFGRGFVLRRFGPRDPRGIAEVALFELLHVAALMLVGRSLVPAVERWRGWRAGGRRLGPPPDRVLTPVPLREAVRRLAREARG